MYGLAVVGVYLTTMLVFSPWQTHFELSPDEGINLEKADLLGDEMPRRQRRSFSTPPSLCGLRQARLGSYPSLSHSLLPWRGIYQC